MQIKQTKQIQDKWTSIFPRLWKTWLVAEFWQWLHTSLSRPKVMWLAEPSVQELLELEWGNLSMRPRPQTGLERSRGRTVWRNTSSKPAQIRPLNTFRYSSLQMFGFFEWVRRCSCNPCYRLVPCPDRSIRSSVQSWFHLTRVKHLLPRIRKPMTKVI